MSFRTMPTVLQSKTRKVQSPFAVSRSKVSTTARILGSLRTEFGLTQGLIVRLSGYSPRAIANWEAGSKATEPAARKFTELQRLFAAIADLTQDTHEVAHWMQEPNPAFDGSTPLQVVERGETDRLWRMIYQLESGEPG
jgi:transcriptional regulator with XRE-family HTH domain